MSGKEVFAIALTIAAIFIGIDLSKFILRKALKTS